MLPGAGKGLTGPFSPQLNAALLRNLWGRRCGAAGGLNGTAPPVRPRAQASSGARSQVKQLIQKKNGDIADENLPRVQGCAAMRHRHEH